MKTRLLCSIGIHDYHALRKIRDETTTERAPLASRSIFTKQWIVKCMHCGREKTEPPYTIKGFWTIDEVTK